MINIRIAKHLLFILIFLTISNHRAFAQDVIHNTFEDCPSESLAPGLENLPILTMNTGTPKLAGENWKIPIEKIDVRFMFYEPLHLMLFHYKHSQSDSSFAAAYSAESKKVKAEYEAILTKCKN